MVMAQGPLKKTGPHGQPRPADPPGGLPVGQRARCRGCARCRRSARSWPRQSRPASSSARAPSSTWRPPRSRASSRSGCRTTPASPTCSPSRRPRPPSAAATLRPPRSAWATRPAAWPSPQFQQQLLGHRAALRAAERAQRRQPRLRLEGRVRPAVPEQLPAAQGALRVPVPVLQRGSDQRAAQARAERRPAPRRHRADQAGHRREGLPGRAGIRASGPSSATWSPVCRWWPRAWPRAVQSAIFVLLIAALLVMAATLAFVFRTRLRLLPLVLALGAAALTFGVLSLTGGSLTMASIAVLPVLIGLAVDYAIQFQARFDEASGRKRGGPEAAAERAAAAGGPTIVTAGRGHRGGLPHLAHLARADGARLRGAAGDRHLPRPGAGAHRGVRGARGAREGRRRARGPAGAASPARRGWAAWAGGYRPRGRRCSCCAAWTPFATGWWTGPSGRWPSRWPSRARCWRSAWSSPWSGIAVDTQSEVNSDIQQLVPQDLQALKDVNALQKETGIAGEIDVTVRADDVTDPKVLAWMGRFQDKVLKKGGYKKAKRDSCLDRRNPPDLCPAFSLTDLFQAGQPPASASRSTRCSTPCPRTSSRGPSPATARPRTWPSASASSRWTSSARWWTTIKERAEPAAGRGRQGGRAAGAGGGGQRRRSPRPCGACPPSPRRCWPCSWCCGRCAARARRRSCR